MWYVYIIRSENFPEQEYVGATADLTRRLSEHNASVKVLYKTRIKGHRRLHGTTPPDGALT